MVSLVTKQQTLRVVDPTISPEWAALVASRPSTLFHSPDWMKVVRDTYNLPLYACILEQDRQSIAGIPWGRINDLLGPRRVTMPFSDVCNPLASSQAEADLLADFVIRQGNPWTLCTPTRSLPNVAAPVAQQTHFKWQGIDLTQPTDTLWRHLRPSAQHNVRLAQRNSLKVQEAVDKSQLREWYFLLLRLRREKYGLLTQPYSFFENLWDTFVKKGAGFLLLATYHDRPVAGALSLLWKDVYYYKFSASNRAYLHLRPNDLLMWEGILAAKNHGSSFLDLGRSSVEQEGLIAFKRGFGVTFEEDIVSVTYSTNSVESEYRKQARQLLRELTGLFATDRLPESMAEKAGALLYRFYV